MAVFYLASLQCWRFDQISRALRSIPICSNCTACTCREREETVGKDKHSMPHGVDFQVMICLEFLKDLKNVFLSLFPCELVSQLVNS